MRQRRGVWVVGQFEYPQSRFSITVCGKIKVAGRCLVKQEQTTLMKLRIVGYGLGVVIFFAVAAWKLWIR